MEKQLVEYFYSSLPAQALPNVVSELLKYYIHTARGAVARSRRENQQYKIDGQIPAGAVNLPSMLTGKDGVGVVVEWSTATDNETRTHHHHEDYLPEYDWIVLNNSGGNKWRENTAVNFPPISRLLRTLLVLPGDSKVVTR